MPNKDFLNQFSGSNKPDSFKEEERVKITKEPKNINYKLIAIIAAAVLLVVGIVLFFVLRPSIEVKEFVGSNVSEVKAWIKQNEIETQGIIFKEEYNFEYDEGYVIEQSIKAGEKIRKNAKIDFVVSIGANPDDLIKVPDIESMYKDEIQQWIKENKLTKTKITTSYSDEKEVGEVVSYEFRNCDEDTFTRSSTLNIVVSKGPQPAGTATVPDFTNKYFQEAETWAKQYKIELVQVKNYSDKVTKDNIISQSVEAKKEMKEGETLTVYVSLGKGILVPDFTKMTDTQVDEWIEENKGYVKADGKYSTSDSYVLSQSIKTGSYIGEDSKLSLTLNLGGNFYLSDISDLAENLTGSYDKCRDKLESLGYLGLNIDAHKNYVTSTEPRGTILAINKIYNGSSVYSKVQRLPLTVDIEFNVSNGDIEFKESDFVGKELSVLRKWIQDNASNEIKIELDDETMESIDFIGSIEVVSGELSESILSHGSKLKVYKQGEE